MLNLLLWEPVWWIPKLLLIFLASLDLCHEAYYLGQINCKLQSHKHVRYLVVCISQLQGADTIERPSACHHPSLASFQSLRNAAELKPVSTFLSVNRNPVILKCQPYQKTDMVFVSLLTPHMTLTVCFSCLNNMIMNIVYIPAPVSQSSAPVSGYVPGSKVHTSSQGEKVWEESDIFEVCSNWRISLKIPWSFCKPRRQSLPFVSGSMVMCSLWVHDCWREKNILK